jgi:SAM-dependent methyltransferase
LRTKEDIEKGLDAIKNAYGEWSYDIPLPFNIWTKGNLGIPHKRLKRILQIVNDLSHKPISECRVLDLGCLDGMFSIEFALHGADTVGVEIRDANIKKAIFCKEILELKNLDFRQDDVRNISAEAYGKFDVIICSGILYHLTATDAIKLINTMHEMTTGLIVIDTHVALHPNEQVLHGTDEYWGISFREHNDKATLAEKAKSLWASADNTFSFWFTRPSLINVLSKAGFSSIYECFAPVHLSFGNNGLQLQDRCTFVALKNDNCEVKTSPTVNGLRENWPEQSLTYAPPRMIEKLKRFYKKALDKLMRTGA